MTTYRIIAKNEDGADEAQVTEDLQDALDWFDNGIMAVVNEEDATVAIMLEIDGVIWGVVKEPAEDEPEPEAMAA